MPPFAFHIVRIDPPIEPRHALWRAFLPAGRACFTDSGEKAPFSDICYADYFQAARAFLEKDDYQALRRGLSHAAGHPVGSSALGSIDIYLVKHGQFYHPAKVEVEALGKRHAWALNVAVSDAGRRIYRREYQCLKRLADEFPVAYAPRVFDAALVLTCDKGPLGLFLAEWFDSFCEFHLGISPVNGQKRVSVWLDNGNILELTQPQVQEVIRKASMILTYYFNPDTLEQIYPWHHGAGDFVVRIQNQAIQVRLTTVRDYASLFRPPDKDSPHAIAEVALLQALFVFWLNLSMRIRLDRSDGVGVAAIYDDGVLVPMVSGFFQGLDLMRELRALPPVFAQAVKAYFLSRTPGEWEDLARAILGRYPSDGAEATLFESHLENHLSLLRQALQFATIPTPV
jgi:hypothetical protein